MNLDPTDKLPKGHRWISVRTDGVITGWRPSTEAEEARFALAEQHAREQSDFEDDALAGYDIANSAAAQEFWAEFQAEFGKGTE